MSEFIWLYSVATCFGSGSHHQAIHKRVLRFWIVHNKNCDCNTVNFQTITSTQKQDQFQHWTTKTKSYIIPYLVPKNLIVSCLALFRFTPFHLDLPTTAIYNVSFELIILNTICKTMDCTPLRLMQFQRIQKSLGPCETFHNILVFYSEGLLASNPTPKLENHKWLLSTINNSVYSQLSTISGSYLSTTWGCIMPWWRGDTSHGYGTIMYWNPNLVFKHLVNISSVSRWSSI
jgi:hypothetical protein